MMNRFDILSTPLEGLKVLRRKPVGDSRGFLERMFCAQEFAQILGGKTIAQINRTLTGKRGSVRGMHFQNSPHAETKFVTCLLGEVFDVEVGDRWVQAVPRKALDCRRVETEVQNVREDLQQNR